MLQLANGNVYRQNSERPSHLDRCFSQVKHTKSFSAEVGRLVEQIIHPVQKNAEFAPALHRHWFIYFRDT